MVIDQLILFHKPNKKLESNTMMDHFVPQSKHPLIVLALNLSVAQEKAYCIALNLSVAQEKGIIHSWRFVTKGEARRHYGLAHWGSG